MKQIESDAEKYYNLLSYHSLGNQQAMGAIAQVKSQIYMVGINYLPYKDRISRAVVAISTDLASQGYNQWDKKVASEYIFIYAVALSSLGDYDPEKIFKDIYLWHFAGLYGESKPNL